MRVAKRISDDSARRLDLWLWFARFFKSRTLATRFVQSGRLRVNARVVKKAHHSLRVGDILTFPKPDRIIVVKVLSLGTRRGPSSEAKQLYEEISAGPVSRPKLKGPSRPTAGIRPKGSGRPTKRERRAIDQMRAE